MKFYIALSFFSFYSDVLLSGFQSTANKYITFRVPSGLFKDIFRPLRTQFNVHFSSMDQAGRKLTLPQLIQNKIADNDPL